MELARLTGLGAVLIVVIWLFAGGIDFRMTSGAAGTSVAVALPPFAALLWPAAVIIAVFSQNRPDRGRTHQPAAWYRAFLALFVDFNLYLLVVAVPIAGSALFYESLYLGELVWAFERDFSRASDRVLLLIALCGLPALWAGLSLPFSTGRSSPGSLAAGIVLTWRSQPPVWRAMLFGPFAYYALAFPFFPFTFVARRLGLTPVALRRTS